MSWSVLTPPAKSGGKSGISFSCVAASRADKSRLRASLVFSKDVCAKHGFRATDHYVLELGGGNHAGSLRIRKHELGLFQGRPGVKECLRFDLGSIHGLPATPQGSSQCRAGEQDDDGTRWLCITLPDWYKRPPAATVARIPDPEKPTGGGMVDVTERVLGPSGPRGRR